MVRYRAKGRASQIPVGMAGYVHNGIRIRNSAEFHGQEAAAVEKIIGFHPQCARIGFFTVWACVTEEQALTAVPGVGMGLPEYETEAPAAAVQMIAPVVAGQLEGSAVKRKAPMCYAVGKAPADRPQIAGRRRVAGGIVKSENDVLRLSVSVGLENGDQCGPPVTEGNAESRRMGEGPQESVFSGTGAAERPGSDVHRLIIVLMCVRDESPRDEEFPLLPQLPIMGVMKFRLSISRILIWNACFLILAVLSLSARAPVLPGDLASAAAAGDERLVRQLLEAGAPPNEPDAGGRTALMYAVMNGSYALTDMLLKNPLTNPDIFGPRGMNPLLFAVASSREDLVVRLLDAGADLRVVGEDEEGRPISPLSLAINSGNFQLARRFFSGGASPGRMVLREDGGRNTPFAGFPEVEVPLDLRIWQSLGELREWAGSPDWNSRDSVSGAVLNAARENRWLQLREMLDAGVSPDTADERGVTPLMTAAFSGQASIISLLLQRGAQVYERDSRGRSALCYAAASGQTDCLRLLLEAVGHSAGELPEENGSGIRSNLLASPLFFALIGSRPDNMRLLLDWGMPSGPVDSEGITLLMAACWLGNELAVRSLLEEGGAQLASRRDHAGRTALEWSLAAFIRDRKSDWNNSRPEGSSRNYSIVRLLARREHNSANYKPQPTKDTHPAVMAAWIPGGYSEAASEWRNQRPSPVPDQGDLRMHRILRDEE